MDNDDLEGIHISYPIIYVLTNISFSTFTDAFVDAFASISTSGEQLLFNNNNNNHSAGTYDSIKISPNTFINSNL